MVLRPTGPSRTNTQKICPFHYKGLECKSRQSRIPGITSKFNLGVQNEEAGQRLTVLLREIPFSNNPRDDSTQGHHQMVNTEIMLIIFFAAEDGEALYSQQKQDLELTMAQILNSLLQNSDLN